MINSYDKHVFLHCFNKKKLSNVQLFFCNTNLLRLKHAPNVILLIFFTVQ